MRRKWFRLEADRYAKAGYYHITVLTHRRKKALGDWDTSGELKLSAKGKIVEAELILRQQRYGSVVVDTFVVMPNHIHMLIQVKLSTPTPRRNDCRRPNGARPDSLASLIGNFKSVTTRKINRMHGKPGGKVWQRGYWDQIVRTERQLIRTRRYIQNNPKRKH